MIKQIDYNIIKWIQTNLRSGVGDFLMNIFTQLGDMYVFILIVIILYWAVNKKLAYKFAIAFIGSAAVNVAFKNLFMRPRPFNEAGIISISEKTHGSSFPSGHAQATGVTFYSLNHQYGKKSKLVKFYSYFILIIVPFTRMYLGQHYLTDVITGVLVGIIVTIGMFKLFDLMGDKEHLYPLFVIPIFIILMIIFKDKGYGNAKDLFVASGGYIGFTVGYAIEKLFIGHNVESSLKERIIKVIVGLALIMIIYFGLKWLFPVNNLWFDSIRYFIIGISGAALIPYLFTIIFKD